MTDDDKMPFGIFKGRRIGDVPAYYLLSLYDEKSEFDDKEHQEVYDYIGENFDYLVAVANLL